ncbi:MAG TPA: hypothetical protein VIY48_19550 [Candidatus Paceibacterota bacterium]
MRVPIAMIKAIMSLFALAGLLLAQDIILVRKYPVAASVHTFSAPAASNFGINTGSGLSTQADVTLGVAPTTAKFVIVAIAAQPTSCIASVADLSGNTYTKTTNSPSSTNDATAGSTWIYYRQPTGTENAVIRTTITGTCSFFSMRVSSFGISPSAGTVIDVDAPAGSGTTGTTINTPTITSPTTGALLYCIGTPENGITGVGATGWTEDPSGVGSTLAEDAEYILSASGSKAANFVQSSGHWDSTCASFK